MHLEFPPPFSEGRKVLPSFVGGADRFFGQAKKWPGPSPSACKTRCPFPFSSFLVKIPEAVLPPRHRHSFTR